MSKEIWKDISGYEGYYQVSDSGRIRSLERILIHKNGKHYRQKERIMKTPISSTGYPIVGLRKSAQRKNFHVHRLVAQAFLPNPLGLPEVNHIDANKKNNCINNLEWVTSKENITHAHNNNLCKHGSDCSFARLTWEQVNEIRKAYIKGSPTRNIKTLAKEYGVSKSIIARVIKNITYFDKNYKPQQNNIQHKLTQEQAYEIRKLYNSHNKEYTTYTLAKKYNVSQATIHNIISNKTYKE